MTAVILSGLMLLPLTACGSTSQTGSDAASSVEPEIVLDVAFENNSSEPIGAGWERAQEIIKEKWRLKCTRTHSWEINHL